MPVPISLIIDDSCPLIHVYRCHWMDVHHHQPLTDDGRPLLEVIPNSFLERFCDVVEAAGMAGKFSIVPSPGGRGDVVRGIEGFDPELTRAWIDTAKRRLAARFDFTSEGITHNLTVDLERGGYIDQGEADWSQSQDRRALTPYLVRQLQLLKDAGVDATGVTSPWVFGIKVEPEYVASIAAAQRQVYGRSFSHYFLHMLNDPKARPWVALRDEQSTLVSIPATVDDYWWQSINSPRADREFIHEMADRGLSADGKSGRIREVLDAGGWPILVTHWQSLFSNGLMTGLASLEELGRRIAVLGGEVRWMNFTEMSRLTVEQDQSAPPPAS